ncbi:hypothetical protein GCM10007140_16110 [Priestia taiwanensis]|uniref:Uncharacterized protein n=2 Tax=Priestia taiwanensis TaxID=1347902 RepID=A0A917EQM4_9BACI|nr:hypothetical protein GCM10007140_16110 [Priestia taiwanensis]
MARCTKCNYKWRLKEIVSLGFSKEGKNYSNCGTKQYISEKTQNALTLGYLSLLFLPLLLFVIQLSAKDEAIYK